MRLLVSPKWIAWHVLTLGAMVSCGLLSAWQWHRAGEAMGSALNVGYGVQWPFFALFFGFMWWHFLRMELQQLKETEVPAPRAETVEPAPAEPEPVPEPVRPEPDDRPSPFTPRPAGIGTSRLSDPQIRAYNDALAELAARDQEEVTVAIATALRIYRVSAWVTGIGLLLLTFYAMPAKYFFGDPRPVALIGMIHGFLYMIYIVCTLILAERTRWKPGFAVLILLAGTIPIASFVAERKVTRKVHAEHLTASR